MKDQRIKRTGSAAAVLLALLALASPANAQMYRDGNVKGTLVSATGSMNQPNGPEAQIGTLAAPAPGNGYLLLLQVCTNVSGFALYLSSPGPDGVFFPVGQGCTRFDPGFVWPAGGAVRAYMATSGTAYVAVTAVLVAE